MLTAHVGALCKAAYFHIRALRYNRKTLSIDDAKTVALIGSRLTMRIRCCFVLQQQQKFRSYNEYKTRYRESSPALNTEPSHPDW